MRNILKNPVTNGFISGLIASSVYFLVYPLIAEGAKADIVPAITVGAFVAIFNGIMTNLRNKKRD
jgi:hypothetical protein